MPTPPDAPYKQVQALRPEKRRLVYDRAKAFQSAKLAYAQANNPRLGMPQRRMAAATFHAIFSTLTRAERRALGFSE